MWIWANWHDIESDLSVFHRVDNAVEMAPQRLIDFAVRLPAYSGVIAARARAEADNGPGLVDTDGVRHVDPSVLGLAADPIFNSIFDFGEAVN